MEVVEKKEFVENLKKEWKTLWRERLDDKVRAEAIANKDYSALFVERGTVIFATRKFKMPSFIEILQLHGVMDVERAVGPHPSVGGWRKFIRTMMVNQPARKRRDQQYSMEKPKPQQLKKGGRGWLHMV